MEHGTIDTFSSTIARTTLQSKLGHDVLSGTMARGRRTNLLQEVASASRGALSLTKVGSGWPADGSICVGSAKAPARIYLGSIGESHRAREDERRFQNPGSDKPIELPEGGICLLLGTWNPNGDSDPVVVAMDAYRRAGLTTRFSMFMPATLLNDAHENGYATHESQTGETLHAFRASKLNEYLSRLIDVRSADIGWAEKDFGPPTDASAIASGNTAPDGSIHIRPKVGMYAAFARLNYKPWFALAEFVDNSIQSYLNHRARLPSEPLQVEIRIDADEITIADRAAGIALREFPRAFSPSQPPPDASGLSEFGLGMKAAACWFSRYWTVRTSALGDPFERLVRFDVDKITSSGIEHLPIEARPARAEDHFSVVTLRNLRVRPQGRTIGKVKEHLESIYRVLMDRGLVRIHFTTPSGTEELKYERPALLNAPYFRDVGGESRLWRIDLNIQLPEKRRVWGWAGLLERGSGSHAGFGVFRRDRLIQGSADDTYRPLRIFRNPNSYTYQRLVGEIFVEGFEVSHTKDGIEWGEYEDEILSQLRRLLNSEEMPMLAQAEGFRVRQKARELPVGFGAQALEGAGAELRATESDVLAPIEESKDASPVSILPLVPLADARVHASYETEISDDGERFAIKLELIQDPTRDWYGYQYSRAGDSHRLEVWMNLSHPFSESYVNSDENTLGPLIRLVAALALAEYCALQGGVGRAGVIRHRVNALLRDSFGEAHKTGDTQ